MQIKGKVMLQSHICRSSVVSTATDSGPKFTDIVCLKNYPKMCHKLS